MSTQSHLPDKPSTMKVVEERLTVRTAREEVGALRVRVENEVHEEPITLDRHVENIAVERVEVNRRGEQRRNPWYENDVLVIPVYAEAVEVERHLILATELRLRRQVTHSSSTSTVALTRQRAVIERQKPDGTWVPIDPDTA